MSKGVTKCHTWSSQFANYASVTFVAATGDDDLSKTSHPSNTSSELSGEEIGQFYSNIINERPSNPSANNHKIANSKIGKKQPKHGNKSTNPAHNRSGTTIVATPTTISGFLRAAQLNDTSHVRRCLDAGIDVEVTDQYGWTALMCAACNGAAQTVRHLLDRGANRRAVDKFGIVAWQLARKNGHLAVAKLLLGHLDPGESGSVFSKDVHRPIKTEKIQPIIKTEMASPSDETLEYDIEQSVSRNQILRPVEPGKNRPVAVVKQELLVADDGEKDTGDTNVAHSCLTCKLTFGGSACWKVHLSSTLHQFNCRASQSGSRSSLADYHIPENNVGFQLMLKDGWNREQGLGPDGTGARYPPKTVLKRDRRGLGNRPASRARITHFGPGDEAALKRGRDEPYGNVMRHSVRREAAQRARSERRKEISLRRELNSS